MQRASGNAKTLTEKEKVLFSEMLKCHGGGGDTYNTGSSIH